MNNFFLKPELNPEGFIDINHEMAPISSVPVPVTSHMVASKWHSKDTNSKYRPTPKINAELTDSARVIHNIMSVPNKVDLKRNEIFNNDYEKMLGQMEEESSKTSINLDDLYKELASGQTNTNDTNK